MAGVSNLFDGIPADLPEELVETLLGASGLRIERIVSRGQASPEGFWYDQDTDEWVLLLAGAARLSLEGEEPLDLRPGAFLNIPGSRRHRVEWTDLDRDRCGWRSITGSHRHDEGPRRRAEERAAGRGRVR